MLNWFISKTALVTWRTFASHAKSGIWQSHRFQMYGAKPSFVVVSRCLSNRRLLISQPVPTCTPEFPLVIMQFGLTYVQVMACIHILMCFRTCGHYDHCGHRDRKERHVFVISSLYSETVSWTVIFCRHQMDAFLPSASYIRSFIRHPRMSQSCGLYFSATLVFFAVIECSEHTWAYQLRAHNCESCVWLNCVILHRRSSMALRFLWFSKYVLETTERT